MTYVDADTSNTAAYDTVAYPDESWLAPSSSGGDDLWAQRTFGNGGFVFTSNDANIAGKEDAPGLVTTISGLTPGSEYTVFAYFWSATNANWRLKASLTETPPLAGDPAVAFSRTGSATSTNTPALADGAASLGLFRLSHSSLRFRGFQPEKPGPGNPPSVLTSTVEFVFTDIDYLITEPTVADAVRYSFFALNGFEIMPTTDSDGDFVPDSDDLNPGQDDATLDADADNLNNLREFNLGTDPTKPDSDEDGWNDDVETDTDIFASTTYTDTNLPNPAPAKRFYKIYEFAP